MQLTQTRLIVSDFAAAFRYYRDVIGLTPQFADAQPPYAALKPAEGSALALHDQAALHETIGSELRDTDRFLICLRVEDLEGYLAEVTARGGVVVAGPITQDGRIRTAYLRDPAGNLTEIQQWLATRSG
jgi:catechol 2,3-dioxygenase-like lactoylglutathione lyase family enzyme